MTRAATIGVTGAATERERSPYAPVGGWGRVDLIVPIVLFVVLLVAKLALVTSATVGPSVDDERLYWQFAGEVSRGVIYEDTKYPPLYPAALAPAFHLPGEPYRNALVLTAIYSSLLVFPVWGISRLVMGVQASTAVVFLQGLLPFHYMMPRTLLSENLFYPLFVAALFMVLWRPVRRAWLWDAGTGVMFAALYLTRYVSLSIIPALVVVWWMREAQAADRWWLDRTRWGRFALMLACTGATFLPWVLVHQAQGTSVALALGFGIASRAVPEQLTLDRLWLYVRMYLAYYALLAAPFLGLVFLSVWETLRERALTSYTRVVTGVGLVSLGMLAALSRHSWRVHYNWPDPHRIMGRYTIYLAVLFLIVAIATLVRLLAEERRGRSWRVWVAAIGVVLPALAIRLSYSAVLGEAVMPFSPASITDRGSIDAYRIILMGPWFWRLAVVSIVLVPLLLLVFRRTRSALPVWIATAAIAGYSLVGVPAYFERMEQHQAAARASREIIHTFDEHDLGSARVLITAEAAEAAPMIQPTAVITMRTFMEGRDIEFKFESIRFAFPFELGREENVGIDDELEYAVVLADGLGPETETLRTWRHRGIDYAFIERW